MAFAAQEQSISAAYVCTDWTQACLSVCLSVRMHTEDYIRLQSASTRSDWQLITADFYPEKKRIRECTRLLPLSQPRPISGRGK